MKRGMSSWRQAFIKLLHVRPYEVELLRPARRVSPLAWIFFVAGGFALIAAALACKPAWDRQTQLAQHRAEIESELARFGLGAPAAASGTKEQTNKDEANALIAELRRPWHELFDQIEAANNKDVHLVQLNIEPRFSTLQLVAEARDLDKLVRFTQRLSGTGPVRTMTMTHHEWHDGLGAHVVRASMEGELVPLWPTPPPNEAKQ
ncbi:MAG TPA: hypothetical protein VEI29_02260 [Burkholderiaceae bacterium]|nr:hypothetical protein [Burkholderiaceae bacterium]